MQILDSLKFDQKSNTLKSMSHGMTRFSFDAQVSKPDNT